MRRTWSTVTGASPRWAPSVIASITPSFEAIWGRMQVELLNRRRWQTRVELANAIFEYLEMFHNRKRRPVLLGCARQASSRRCPPTRPQWHELKQVGCTERGVHHILQLRLRRAENGLMGEIIPAVEGTQRPDGYIGVIDQHGNKSWLSPDVLTSRPPTSSLSDEQVERIRAFKQVLAEHDRTSLEEALTNFRRDRHPEGEIRLWELTARVYDAELCARPAANAEERSLLFQAVFTCALGVKEVEAAIVSCPALDRLSGLEGVMRRFMDEATESGNGSTVAPHDSQVPSRPAGFEYVDTVSPEAVDFATDFMGVYFDNREEATEMINISRRNEGILLRGLCGLVDAVVPAMMETRSTDDFIQELDYWADKDSGSGSHRIAATLIASRVGLKVGDRWFGPRESQGTDPTPVLRANVESLLAGILWSFIEGMASKTGRDDDDTFVSLAELAHAKAAAASRARQASEGERDSLGNPAAGERQASTGPIRPVVPLDPEAEDTRTWARLEPNDVARKTVGLVVQYLEACRRGDYTTMFELPGIHVGALMAGLVRCAAAIVPVFRETVEDDDAYLEVMDGFALSEDGSDTLVRASVVQMLNSQGGVEAPERWTGPGTVEMSAAMVEEVAFGMAVTLNALINLTADLNEHDKDQAFRSFIGLLQNEAA